MFLCLFSVSLIFFLFCYFVIIGRFIYSKGFLEKRNNRSEALPFREKKPLVFKKADPSGCSLPPSEGRKNLSSSGLRSRAAPKGRFLKKLFFSLPSGRASRFLKKRSLSSSEQQRKNLWFPLFSLPLLGCEAKEKTSLRGSLFQQRGEGKSEQGRKNLRSSF